MADGTRLSQGTQDGDKMDSRELNTLDGVDVSGQSPKPKIEGALVAYSDGSASARHVASGFPLPVVDASAESSLTTLAGTVADGDALATATVPSRWGRGLVFNGTTWDRLRGGVATDSNAAPGILSNAPLVFNGSTWDRQRGNWSTTALSSAARTATTNSTDFTNYTRALIVLMNVTAVAVTGGLTVKVQGKDSVSSNYYDIFSDATPVTATGLYVFEVGPGVAGSASAGVRGRLTALLPRVFRVQVAVGDSSSYTYSVGAQFVI